MTNEFEDKNTYRLGEVYSEWLAANGFEGDEPADELLMFSKDLTNRQLEWLEDFCAAFKEAERSEEIRLICERWAKTLGLAWHPDTRGEQYTPDLPGHTIKEYDADMKRLFEISEDPYGDAIDALERLRILDGGLI